MKTTNYCIALPLAAAIALLPAFGALSNLDKKYGTNGSRRTTTTNRKPAATPATRHAKPAKPAEPAVVSNATNNEPRLDSKSGKILMPKTVNPANDERLTKHLALVQKFFEAWHGNDDEAMLDMMAPNLGNLVTSWNQRALADVSREDAVGFLYDAPKIFRERFQCDEGYYIVKPGSDSAVFSLLLKLPGGQYNYMTIAINKEMKVHTLFCIAGIDDRKTALEYHESFIEEIGTAASVQSLHIDVGEAADAAAQPETGAVTVKRSATIGTWGGKDTDFSDSPLVLQAEKMTAPDKYCDAVLSLYRMLRTRPLDFKHAMEENQKLLEQLADSPDVIEQLPASLTFKNSIQLLGENREISRDEFFSMLEARKMRWPMKTVLEAVSVRGAHITVTHGFETFGYAAPVHVSTEFLLDKDGVVTAIGETQVSATPAALAEHAAGTWGQTDVDLLKDPACTALPEYKGNSTPEIFASSAKGIATSYQLYRAIHSLTKRQSGDFSFSAPFRKGKKDVTVFGTHDKMTFSELQCALLEPALCFPEKTTVMDYGTRDQNKVEVIYKLELPGEEEPVYLKTLFLFDDHGDVSAIGETRCYDTDPVLDEGFKSANK